MKVYRKVRKNKFVDAYFYSKKMGKYSNKLLLSLVGSGFITILAPYFNGDFDNELTKILGLILSGGIFYEMFLDAEDKIKFRESKRTLKQVEAMFKEKGYDISFEDENFFIPRKTINGMSICYDDFLFDCTKDKIMFTDENGKVFDVTDDINKVLKKKRKKLD